LRKEGETPAGKEKTKTGQTKEKQEPTGPVLWSLRETNNGREKGKKKKDEKGKGGGALKGCGRLYTK